MTWKHNLQLRDLDGDQRIEVTCLTCGYGRYEEPLALLENRKMRDAYLHEVEVSLTCNARGCGGSVRIALTCEAETEGFMGGLP